MSDEFSTPENPTAYDKTHKAVAPSTPEPTEPEKKVEKVIRGKAVRRKKSFGTKFKEMFVGADADTVREYVIYDVAIPALKDMISDATSGGIDRILFGDGARSRTRSSHRGRYDEPRIAYHRMSPVSDKRRRHDDRHDIRPRRRSNMVDEILLDTRAEAEDVLGKMYDLLERYDTVSVSDLNSLVGLTGPFTDDNWGWTDLQGSRTKRVREGYLLILPDPIELD